MILRSKPHKILWWTIPILFLPMIFGWNTAFDIQVHDTYLVIAAIHIAIVCSILFGLVGLIYRHIKKPELCPNGSILKDALRDLS